MHKIFLISTAIILAGAGCTQKIATKNTADNSPLTEQTAEQTSSENSKATGVDTPTTASSTSEAIDEKFLAEINSDSLCENGEKPAIPTEWKTFAGAYFDIRYPDTFIVQPSIPTGHTSKPVKVESDVNYDSAFFISPDGRTSFYVYSPLWTGDPTDSKTTSKEDLATSTTQIVSNKTCPTLSNNSSNHEVTRTIYRAKDASYYRAMVTTVVKQGDSETKKIFGIKFATKADYQKYADEYQAFKQSLAQFAD